MIGAILLVVPGFFTDALGLLLADPGVRICCCAAWSCRPRPAPRDDIIDGDYTTLPIPIDRSDACPRTRRHNRD